MKQRPLEQPCKFTAAAYELSALLEQIPQKGISSHLTTLASEARNLLARAKLVTNKCVREKVLPLLGTTRQGFNIHLAHGNGMNAREQSKDSSLKKIRFSIAHALADIEKRLQESAEAKHPEQSITPHS